MTKAATTPPAPVPSPGDPIGVFDSGMGGLSVAREILRELPEERIVYYADNMRMPYGSRPPEEVRRFAVEIAEALFRRSAKAVVIACNTASAAALRELRELHPGRIFVGMEPAVKPAARDSKTGKIGVLATAATLRGALFESVVERFAAGVEIIRQPCPGLAEFIEAHPPDDPGLVPLLEEFIRPLREAGADQIVLGCTHYPLVADAVRRVAGAGIHIVDPSTAVARRVRRALEEQNLLRGNCGTGELELFVGGDAEAFSVAASNHLQRKVRAETGLG